MCSVEVYVFILDVRILYAIIKLTNLIVGIQNFFNFLINLNIAWINTPVFREDNKIALCNLFICEIRTLKKKNNNKTVFLQT